MKAPDVCIYHKGCTDGFAAAWVVHDATRDTEKGPPLFQAAAYGSEPPADLKGLDVLIVDFCYPLHTMRWMAANAARVTVLDHHATARDAMQELMAKGDITGVFDMEHSGAMLAWHHFHGREQPPAILDYVQDRDLWRHRLRDTHTVNAALRSYPMAFDTWDGLMRDRSLSELAHEGKAIQRYRGKLVRAAVESAYMVELAGHEVPVTNAMPEISSEVGHALSAGRLFAATYYDDGESVRRYSLRSSGDFDVGAFARDNFGGGGHKGAAGFEIGRMRSDDCGSSKA